MAIIKVSMELFQISIDYWILICSVSSEGNNIFKCLLYSSLIEILHGCSREDESCV